MPEKVKICRRCKKEFPATSEHFHVRRLSSDGLMPVCKECGRLICREKFNPVNVDCGVVKQCSICGESLPATIEHFHREKAGKHGLRSSCKPCNLKKKAEWRSSPEVSAHTKAYDAKRRATDEFREKNRRYHAKRMQDPKHNVTNRISCGIRTSLRTGGKSGMHWEKLVGYTISQLMRHIEKQFKPGMSWKNMGEWHIDHKIPISAFNYTTVDHLDFRRCWSLKNLQPLWASENISKGCKIAAPFQPHLPLELESESYA